MRKQQLLVMILFLCLGLPAMAQFHGAEVHAKIGDEAFYTSYKPANAQFWTGVGQLVGGGALAGYSFYRDCTTYNGTTSVDGAKNVKFAHLYTWPITGEIFGAATAVFGIYDIIAGVSGMKKTEPIRLKISSLKTRRIADIGLMAAGVGAAVGGKFWLDKHAWWVETTLEGGEVVPTGDRDWALPMATIGVGALLFNYGLERFVFNTSRIKGSSKVSLHATPLGLTLNW